MSDVMLHGVLNMPPELWDGSEIDKIQRYGRYLQASRRIEDLTRALEQIKLYHENMHGANASTFIAYDIACKALEKV